MIELLATTLVTVSSVALFGYWFRYTCLLILSTKTAQDYAAQVATANQLGFLEVRSQLQAASTNLDGLCASLDRDYAVLSGLLKNADSQSALEKRMLEANYKVMHAWYDASRRFSPAAAARALDEMSQVIAHFANVMGESASCAAAA
jgi:Skp family chaperone for outer membrane proteins